METPSTDEGALRRSWKLHLELVSEPQVKVVLSAENSI